MKSPLSKFVLLLTLLFSANVQSEMYKWVDEEGHTNYSDKQPFKSASEHVAPDINTTPAIAIPKPQAIPQNTTSTKETQYTLFKITSPEHNATIRNNQGNFSIRFALQPPLNTEQGHYISLLLDNKLVQDKLTSLSAQFSNIDRGTHQIAASIKNKRGKILFSTENTSIHMHRKSVLNP